MRVNIYKIIEELIQAMADHTAMIAQNIIVTHGIFNIALSGENSPRKPYELLATWFATRPSETEAIYKIYDDFFE